MSTERNFKKKNEDDTGGIYNRQRRTNNNDRNGSGLSTSTVGKAQDNNINRRQFEPVHFHRPNGIDDEQRIQKSKHTGLVLRHKIPNDKCPR